MAYIYGKRTSSNAHLKCEYLAYRLMDSTVNRRELEWKFIEDG